ncbi:hypothetical protein GLYMA_15G233500v4 [Glycine max]|uniref:Uncharacterized protein n=1 Tax=Glycine max TaxID=3847 RepID=A0A0R0GG49_SOYBN|nr:hypothetical protein GLYMA_15G233500v4 [Glycine max]
MKILPVPFVIHIPSSKQKNWVFCTVSHNILNRVLESVSSLLLPPCISMSLANFKSSINFRVCKIIPIILQAF